MRSAVNSYTRGHLACNRKGTEKLFGNAIVHVLFVHEARLSLMIAVADVNSSLIELSHQMDGGRRNSLELNIAGLLNIREGAEGTWSQTDRDDHLSV